MIGGIDLGGTKIETCLFDRQLNLLAKQRVATPRADYDALLTELLAQCDWLAHQAGRPDLPIGIGVPGQVHPATGHALMSNLPAHGHPLQADLVGRIGRPVALGNDCRCFALSEAHSGAARGLEAMVGCIIGTGIGTGVVIGGRLRNGRSGVMGEFGHLAIPAHLVQLLDLPTVRCGCGRTGCFETLGAGPGLARLATHFGAPSSEPAAIVAGARQGHAPHVRAYDAWKAVVAELLFAIQVSVDPQCVVLGGGLSRIPGLIQDLTAALKAHTWSGMGSVPLAIAEHGDSSGVRGAALLALHPELAPTLAPTLVPTLTGPHAAQLS